MFDLFNKKSDEAAKVKVSLSAQNTKRSRRIEASPARSVARSNNKILQSFEEILEHSKERVAELPNAVTGHLRQQVIVLESTIQSRVIMSYKADTASPTLKTVKSKLGSLGYLDVLDAKLSDDCWENLSERIKVDLKETHGSVLTSNESLKTWSTIIDYGINRNASDIHILCDPAGSNTSIRYRIDGLLQEHASYSQFGYSRILDAVRAAWRSPQNKLTGKEKEFTTNNIRSTVITHSAQGQQYDLRFQQTPSGDQSSSNGETGFFIAMRLTVSGSNAKLIELEDYGYSSFTLELIDRRIRKFNGLSLISGPTGSGKSTASLAMVKTSALRYPTKSIQTIEDPIETTVGHNVSQYSVSTNHKTGVSGYVEAMKSKLRQDPDLIYCGEVQGEEMATLTMSAAKTGHMTIATLHSDSALLIPDNFASKGVAFESMIGPSGLMLAISQKLVGRACPECSKPINRGDDAILYEAICRVIPDDLLGNVVVRGEKDDCPVCEGRGIKGRCPVEEALPFTDEVQEVVLSRNFLAVKKEWYKFEIGVALNDGYHGRTIEDRAIFLVSKGIILANELYLLIENFEQCRPTHPSFKDMNSQDGFNYIWGRKITPKLKKPGFVGAEANMVGISQ